LYPARRLRAGVREQDISKLLGLLALFWTAGLQADNLGRTYPGAYSDMVNAAQKEGHLVIYSVMHADAAVSDLLREFRARYPFIEVRNYDDDGALTYRRFIREVSAGRPSADFIWSSAMDLQEKLINDGFSRAYASPEMPALPAWAHWQDLGYGVTLEPVAFVYNSRYLESWEMPRTHAGLNAMLAHQIRRFQGRIAVYNPEKSEVGMLLLSQDIRVTRDSWNLFDTLGAANAQLYSTSRDMLINILKGNQWMGYDVIASYAVEMQKIHPELVVVYPTDYILDLSRVAFVTASATHPNAAKLFLNFLLSQEGQIILEKHGMGPVRKDLSAPTEQAHINPIRTRAIRIGPGLLSDLDSLVRAQFLRRWRQARIPPD
jgi:iron(III) transport system substrate-binding protein